MDSTIISYANVLLFAKDSLVMGCVSSPEGFSLNDVPEGSYNLKITFIGYKTREIFLDINRSIDLGKIVLEPGYNLDEVSVIASRSILSHSKGIIKVTVENTYLSNLPSINNLLGNIPGILISNGKIESFGKGQPLILIDGKELKSEAQLYTIQPSHIKEIIVDNTPGVKYDSRYSSVIDIKTSRLKPALLIYNTTVFARRFSDMTGINSQLNFNKTTLDLTYGFRKRDNKLYAKVLEKSFYPSASFENIYQDTTFSQRLSHNWSAYLSREFGKHKVYAEYSGYHSTNNPIYNALLHTQKNEETASYKILRTGKYKESQHAISLGYSFPFQENKELTITADYLKQIAKNKDNTTENEVESGKRLSTPTEFTGKYNIFSVLTEYDYKPNDKFNLLSGARYSRVYNDNKSLKSTISNWNELKENRAAVYILGRFGLKRIALQIGLRGEVFDQQYMYDEKRETDYKRMFFLPSFKIDYPLSENVRFSLSGNKKISLPSFNEITPIVTYFNQYSYSIGNPLLKPASIYDLNLEMTLYNKINITAGYNEIKNDRIEIPEFDSDDIQIIKYTSVNIKKSRKYVGKIAYSNTFSNCHIVNLSGGILFPDTKIHYHTGNIHYTKPTCFAQFNYNWKIGNMINLSIGYLFRSKSYNIANIDTETHSLQSNISVVPIKNKLFISLQANDILRKSGGNWQTNYTYFKTQQLNNHDNRNVTFSIRYILSTFKRVEKSSSNEEEINRL